VSVTSLKGTLPRGGVADSDLWSKKLREKGKGIWGGRSETYEQEESPKAEWVGLKRTRGVAPIKAPESHWIAKPIR